MKGDHYFLKRWIKRQTSLIQMVHPEWDKEKIKSYLDKVIDKKCKFPMCAVSNNYMNRIVETTLMDIYDFIVLDQPILAGGGVMFRQHAERINPPAVFLDGALKKRKEIKKQLKNFKPGSYEYIMIDLKQLTEKVVANSYYGASGNDTSPFYNLFTAIATTGTGQSLISCMMTAFENFYSNNVLFYDLDDALLYIKNSLNKTVDSFEIEDMPNIERDQVINKLRSMFKDKKNSHNEYIIETLSTVVGYLNQDELNKLYYSSNLFEFIKIPSIEELILDIIYNTETFKDPNSVPKNVKHLLDRVWDILLYWVVYDYPSFNRINRLKFEQRKVVVTIDTDSNMLNIDKWMKYWDTKIDIHKTVTEDSNEIMYIKCNILCYLLTKYTQVVLAHYAKIANIKDESAAARLNMKNEFLYLRMILSDKKKRYTGIIRLREGNELIPEKLDCKGLDYMKSTCSKQTKDYFMKLVSEDILYAETISGTKVLRDIRAFINYIQENLDRGEKTFLSPLSVKEPEAYVKPFSNQGIRGTYVWNCLYPGIKIQLPDKVVAVKVNMQTKEDIEQLKYSYPEYHKILIESVFDNPDCPFRDKGVNVICIPSQVDKVPDWITPYINSTKIIGDNITKIYPILKSLGLSLIESRSNEAPHYSNIVTF